MLSIKFELSDKNPYRCNSFCPFLKLEELKLEEQGKNFIYRSSYYRSSYKCILLNRNLHVDGLIIAKC